MRSLRETSSVMAYPIGAGSVSVLQVALVALQRRYRLFGRQRLYVGVSAYQGGTHIFCHILGIAAYVEIRAAVEPFDQVAAPVPHLVLDVNLLGRIAREGHVHTGEPAVG